MKELNKDSFRRSYESCLDLAARLSCFSASSLMLNADAVTLRQTDLALDDLVIFALHARRLINDASLYELAIHIEICNDSVKKYSLWEILGIIIHCEKIQIARNEFESKFFFEDGYAKSLFKENIEDMMVNPNLKPISPLVQIKSDKSDFILFNLKHFIEIFSERIVPECIGRALAKRIFLEDIFQD
jgi:hypothetical protein